MGKNIYLSDAEIEVLFRVVADTDSPETEEDAEISEKLLAKLSK